jgi:hypothetical protein
VLGQPGQFCSILLPALANRGAASVFVEQLHVLLPDFLLQYCLASVTETRAPMRHQLEAVD